MNVRLIICTVITLLVSACAGQQINTMPNQEEQSPQVHYRLLKACSNTCTADQEQQVLNFAKIAGITIDINLPPREQVDHVIGAMMAHPHLPMAQAVIDYATGYNFGQKNSQAADTLVKYPFQNHGAVLEFLGMEDSVLFRTSEQLKGFTVNTLNAMLNEKDLAKLAKLIRHPDQHWVEQKLHQLSMIQNPITLAGMRDGLSALNAEARSKHRQDK